MTKCWNVTHQRVLWLLLKTIYFKISKMRFARCVGASLLRLNFIDQLRECYLLSLFSAKETFLFGLVFEFKFSEQRLKFDALTSGRDGFQTWQRSCKLLAKHFPRTSFTLYFLKNVITTITTLECFQTWLLSPRKIFPQNIFQSSGNCFSKQLFS